MGQILHGAHSVVGLAGSGLTSACLERYLGLLGQTHRPERILFLVRNQAQAKQVLGRLRAAQPTSSLVGPLQIETFVEFVLRQLREHWAEVREQISDLPPSFEPQVLAKDLTQFLLSQTCAQCPQHGDIYGQMTLRDYQFWDQLSSVAYIAGSSDIEPAAVGERLAQAWDGDPSRRQFLRSLSCCVGRLRQQALRLGSLDFGTQIALFRRTILPLEAFWQDIDHLIVDQAEDSSGVALEFYQLGLERLKSLFFAYTLGGGSSFTGVPGLMKAFLIDHTQVTLLTGHHKGSVAMAYFGHRIGRDLNPALDLPFLLPLPAAWPDCLVLDGETQLEAAKAMIGTIRSLWKKGIRPEQIAVIVPRIEVGLTLGLQEQLGDRILPLRSFPSLIKYPLVRALLTLLELAHPGWGLFPSVAEHKLMLGILLGLDPIRAELLAEDTLDGVGRSLRSEQAVRLPERVSFAALARYQELLGWLKDYQKGTPLPVDQFLRRFFADQLATRIPAPEEQNLLQSLIDVAQRFRQSLPHLEPRQFLGQIRSSQVASRGYQDPDLADALVVATPIDYINRGLSADYQFWFGITEHSWSRATWRPLYTPRPLTRAWDGEPIGQEQDQQIRHEILANTLLNLCCRCRQGLWLVRSAFNARGEENASSLDRRIRQVYEEMIR